MPAVVPESSVTNPDSNDGRTCADSDAPICLVVDVVHEAGDWGALAPLNADVAAAASALASALDLAPSEACLALSSDDEVARLNATYRGKPSPTNVLSFPASAAMADERAGPRFLGDLILARETVVREAGELGLPVKHHVQHLVVHGLLHLIGYDHETEAEADEMEALEVRILASLGIANPYLAAADQQLCRRDTDIAQS